MTDAIFRRSVLPTLSLSILIGSAVAQTSPSFVYAKQYTTGLAPYGAKVVDVDGDGDRDILTNDVTGDETSTISVLKNNGDGTFAAPASYGVGKSAQSFDVADFNGDGRPDVVAANSLSGERVDEQSTVTVLLNNGSGAFNERRDYNIGVNARPEMVRVGDFNGDGIMDWAATSSYTYKISIFRGLGNGQFSLYASPQFESSRYISVADLNGDGRSDIVSGNTDAFRILFNNGGGSFTDGPYVSNYPDGIAGVATGDMDGDGDVDVVTTNRFMSVWTNNGNGTSFGKASYFVGENPQNPIVADLDGNGSLDVAASNYLANSISTWFNGGNGTFADRRDWGVGANPWSFAIGDVNGDNKPDIVAPNSQLSQTTVDVVINSGSRFFVARREYGMEGEANGVESADFNHDGFPDVVSGAYVSNRDGAFVFYGTADGSLQHGVKVEDWGNNIPTDVAVADFNRDGWADFCASIFSPGNRVRVHMNNGSGGFRISTSHTAGGDPSGVGVGDLNGDGWPDIVNTNGSQLDNSIHYFINNHDANGGFQAGVRVPTLFRPSDVVLGDFDRDGDDDILVTHYGNNNVLIFRTNADGTPGAQQSINVGSSQGTAVVRDFDGDGWLDVAVAAGTIKILRNDHNGGFTIQNTGIIGGRVAVADFDADGDLDLAGTGLDKVYVGRNDGGSFVQLPAMPAGYQADQMNAADLNRDGLPEILVANHRSRSVSVYTNNTPRADFSPTAFTLARGVLVSGGLAELGQSDDAWLQIRPGITPTSAEAPIQLVLDGRTSVTTPTELRFSLEASTSIGNLNQTVQLWDYILGAYVTLDTRLATLSDQTIQVTATDPSRFVQAGTGNVRARILYKAAGPLSSFPFRARLDRAYWTVR